MNAATVAADLASTVAQRAGRHVDGLRQWAQAVQGRTHHNKAACALANKMARICYATLRDGVGYAEESPPLAKRWHEARMRWPVEDKPVWQEKLLTD
jgi:hypothetical protein